MENSNSISPNQIDQKQVIIGDGSRNFGWKYFLVVSILNLIASIVLMMLEFIYHRSDLEIGVFLLPFACAFYFLFITIVSFAVFGILYFSRIRHQLIFFPSVISAIVFALLIPQSMGIYREFLPGLFIASSFLFLVYYLFDPKKTNQLLKNDYFKLIISIVVLIFFCILIFVPNNFLGIKTSARPSFSAKKVVPADQFDEYNIGYSGSNMSGYWISIGSKENTKNPLDEVNDYTTVRVLDQGLSNFPKEASDLRINNREAKILCRSYYNCSVYFIVANNYSFEVSSNANDGVFKTDDGVPINRPTKVQKEIKDRLTLRAISMAKIIEQNARYLEVGR